MGSCRGHPALIPAWTDDPQTQTPRVLQASAHHLMSFWRKTKRLNKAASPSTLTSFKRPLLKAPGSASTACWGSVSRERLLGDSGFQASHGPAAAQASRLPHGRWGSRPGRGWSCWPPSGAAEVVLLPSYASFHCQPSTCGVSSQCRLSSLPSAPGQASCSETFPTASART